MQPNGHGYRTVYQEEGRLSDEAKWEDILAVLEDNPYPSLSSLGLQNIAIFNMPLDHLLANCKDIFKARMRPLLSNSDHNIICTLPCIYSHTIRCGFIQSSFRTIHSHNASSFNMSNPSAMFEQTDFSLVWSFCRWINWWGNLLRPPLLWYTLTLEEKYYSCLNGFTNVKLILSKILFLLHAFKLQTFSAVEQHPLVSSTPD